MLHLNRINIHSFTRIICAMLLSIAFDHTVCAATVDTPQPNAIIDWAKGDVQSADSNCGDIEFRHMADDHVYSFLVRGRQVGTCAFHADGLTFSYPSNYGPTINGTRTFFGFARFGSNVLVTWAPGY